MWEYAKYIIFSHEFSFWNLNCKLQACPLIQLLHPQTHYIGNRLRIHLVVIPLFSQCHINNNLMHFHPKRFTFQRKRRRRTNKEYDNS
ncbi:uncharacterized protein LOC114294326 isoform X2 [Camellia sinensis]|uniref:uncharacterized protein LOC114294326 isoform X2 n=1 Tax=Camellia sinensis TaxID=4442 RepID=UPI0010367646|nr:uncharacterized protein LOC114294326 isoform X2 [Camellia sinensis]